MVIIPYKLILLLTEILGTNHGFGWHTADLWPELLVEYKKVQTTQHLCWPY